MVDFLDDFFDLLGEGWDVIVEGFDLVISGDIFGEIGEFFSTMFEGLTEFSITGLLFGIIGFLTVFLLRKWMLMPFLKFYTPSGQIFWGAVTYIGTFIAGYMLGKYFENTG